MFDIKLKITEDEVTPKLEGLQSELHTAITVALYEANIPIQRSVEPLVPFERGYLEDSYDDNYIDYEDVNILEIEYSGRDNPYAKGYDYAYIQHENPSFRHPIKGEHKYLEKGLKLAFPTVLKTIDKSLDTLFF